MKIFIYIALVEKMSKAKLNFGDVEDKKSEFHASKHPIHIDKADIKKIVIYNKISYGKTFYTLKASKNGQIC